MLEDIDIGLKILQEFFRKKIPLQFDHKLQL